MLTSMPLLMEIGQVAVPLAALFHDQPKLVNFVQVSAYRDVVA